MSISVIIMAAGLGTRMKSNLPKVLHKISNHPMLYHTIKEAKTLSDDIQVILYHKSELIIEQMGEYFSDVSYILQDHQNFPGTGGAVKSAKPKYKKVLVLNGDMPLVTKDDLEPLLACEDKVVMSVFEAKNPSGYGRVILNDTLHVEKIVEEKDASEDEKKVRTVNAGVYLFDRDFLHTWLPKLNSNNSQNEYYITDLVKIASENNEQISAVQVDEQSFMGVNSKLHLSQAEEIMQDKIKFEWMEKGVTIRAYKSVFIDSMVEFVGECEVESGAVILGKTTIKNSTIRANSVIESSVIENSSVGPLARVRPKCHITDSHIGNFVELKNSTLNGVKAGHLSYLGDSSIDEGTNVGCGTITCNYDGKNKYKTIIGKNVFIGSDVQLIAPVRVEDNVLIAAGTTVNKDIPKGALAISRSELKIKDGFFAKFFGK